MSFLKKRTLKATISILDSLLSLVYRIKTENINIPDKGRCVVICNHVSYVDALILMVKLKRKMRFVVYEPIYNNPFLKPFFKMADCIPITGSRENKSTLAKAMRSIDDALRSEQAVMIFPEGMITYDGKINDFKPGVINMVKKTPAPIYPVGISGLYGSHFSRSKNKGFLGKFFSKITVKCGAPIHKEAVTTSELRQKVCDLVA